jgi:hypothetical protein
MACGLLRQQMVLTDWDQFLEAVQPWDVSGCIVTDRNQPFQATVRGVMGSDFYLIHTNVSRRFHQNGSTPQGFTSFAVMSSNSTPARFRRHDAYPRIGLTQDHEFDGASEPGFDVFLFGFADEAYGARFDAGDHVLGNLHAADREMLESERTRVQSFEQLAGCGILMPESLPAS